MMRRLFPLRWFPSIALVYLATGFVVVALAQSAPDQPPGLTETQRLQAEIHALKGQLLEARYQLATCQAQQQATALSQERVALEAEFRQRLQPPEGATFDWQTLTFTAPSPSPPERTP